MVKMIKLLSLIPNYHSEVIINSIIIIDNNIINDTKINIICIVSLKLFLIFIPLPFWFICLSFQ